MYLEKVRKELLTYNTNHVVYMPSLWVNKKSGVPAKVNYATFIAEQIDEIKKNREHKTDKHQWTKDAIIYNCFVRFCTAYDHDQDGKVGDSQSDITLNKHGIRETGTFLKTIALLPYIKNLGVNTLHLLPITKIGLKGRKGDMGSPYAIKNPYEIDPFLADPVLSLSIEDQYRALIEAINLLGMRVVQEFIFRTAAIDSDWSNEHPDWFYWIKDNTIYGPPKFSKKQLKEILNVPKGAGTYIPPRKKYRDSFQIPDQKVVPKNSRIASAFADWPPDDLQPPWTDVTYLRLYNYDFKKKNNFNYIAYNTIRYYDPELAQKTNINHELWHKISGIIPYYQQNFGIHGAMIDMGHALPNELKIDIIAKARENDPEFAFWDENFDNTEETKKDGYNAVIGDSWHKIAMRNGVKNIISRSLKPLPLKQFGAAETHNSPRFGKGNLLKKKAAWLLFNIMPNTVPFLHNGFELNESMPVNTGLNFNEDEIKYFSNQRLALFDKNGMNWDTELNIVNFIQKVSHIRTQYPWIFNNKDIAVLLTDNKKVLGFEIGKNKNKVFVLFNTNYHKQEWFDASNIQDNNFLDLFREKKIVFKNNDALSKGAFLLLKVL